VESGPAHKPAGSPFAEADPGVTTDRLRRAADAGPAQMGATDRKQDADDQLGVSTRHKLT